MFASLPVDPSKYSAFLAAMLLMAITPGPANLFCISTGLKRSVPRVLMGVFGINSATLIWFVMAAFGLHILITTVPVIFHLMTFGGALYLLWIAYKTVRARKSHTAHELDVPTTDQIPQSLWATWKDGFMVQFLNPKVTLFFTAVLPPFLDLGRPMTTQMPVFAATAIGMDVITMTTYGLSGLALTQLLSRGRNREYFELFVGCLLGLIALLILGHGVADLLKSA
ncbi:LysE family translocator [Asticcacaulis sp. BYS171W]|uniref:LysE family translocator n=1 Tax=Asticcacaulis aquaticus TaxID=2984212 RepID=A0ABT5HSK2_9CAUL|nr:LysE family translocator [Asticcacaulis aquaticus]MDC7683029.1 LysE family translocator [Asticcacaulis aquaticus]